MLVAYVNNIEKIASEVEKDEGPFYCTCCGKEVGLKKGDIKIHHFYHLQDNPECLKENESERHLTIKYEMYKHFLNQPNCSNCKMERVLKGVIPDVSLYINGKRVAIEIQNSNISYKKVKHRMEVYARMDIYVLWVLADSKPSTDFTKRFLGIDYEYHNLKNWEKYLHNMYFQRLYYWQEKTTVKAVHFAPVLLQHDGGEDYPDSQYRAKKRTAPIQFLPKLVIERDFYTKDISENEINLSYGPAEIPKTKIYRDKNRKWWNSNIEYF